MSEKEYDEVIVWDLSYALQDEDGNYKHGADGKVEVYDQPDEDCQHIAEYIKPEDLEKREPVITSTEKLIEKIRDICSTNVDADWLENDPSEEFAEIVKLIDAENKS